MGAGGGGVAEIRVSGASIISVISVITSPKSIGLIQQCIGVDGSSDARAAGCKCNRDADARRNSF